MNSGRFLVAVGLVSLLAVSCSGFSSTPVAPDSTQTPVLTLEREVRANQGGTHLWGLWQVYVDPVNDTIEVVPLRGASFTCNVVRFADGPPSNLFLNVISWDIQPDYRDIVVDVGLRHPFPGLDRYTGFDVLGVFMGNGTDFYLGPDGFPTPGDNDQQMLNPDGYTRWFNAPEFGDAGTTLPLVGYYPGRSGTPGYTPSAYLNPYRYFADGLGEEDEAFEFLMDNSDGRGAFAPGNVNYRRYEIRLPTGLENTFQYAVIAHWEPNLSFPDPPPDLDDFPLTANADEAVVVSVVDHSTLYYGGPGDFGGSVILEISPWDWSAEPSAGGGMREYTIRCYSSAWTGEYAVDMMPVDVGDHWCTFRADIPVESLHSTDPLPVWIEISYPELDYTNRFGVENDAGGVLASYFRCEVPVSGGGSGGWARTWGGSSYDGGFAVAADGSGNVYVTGEFHGTVDFDPGGGDPHTSNGWYDVFLSKFDSSGNFEWARTWGGGLEDYGEGVAADSSGNVYVTGYFRETVDFDPGGGDPLTSNGRDDVFLSKFDSSGNFEWGRTWGGGLEDYGEGVAADSSGNVCVTGYFHETVDFDPDGGDPHTSNGLHDVFLSKFDSSGNFEWARTWGGSDPDIGWEVATDGSGNVYVTGYFYETVDFDPGGGDPHTSNGGWDSFLSKFDSSGNFVWARTWGGSSSDSGRGVAADGSGNVYVTGHFSDTVDFDPGGGDLHTSNGWRDAFLSKFDSLGNFEWARTWGGSHYDRSHGVAADGSGNVYVTGYFHETVDFDPDGGDPHTSNGGYDVFLSKFDSSGNFEWARTWGGSSIYDCGCGVAADGSGNAYVTGYFWNTVDFAPTGLPCNENPDEHTSNGGRDAFLAKHLPNGCWH